jgi:hypothetical protein
MIGRFIHSVTYAPLKALCGAFAALGFILGLYQGIIIFFPDILKKTIGWTYFLAIILLSLIYGRVSTWKKSKIAFKIPHTNTTIEIIFGDLFKQCGIKVIPVNEFFDSEIGNPVSSKSLHGILIQKHLKGQSFDALVNKQLANIQAFEIKEKTEGKQKCYPIGTTVIINTDSDYLVFALSKTRPDTCKAYCDLAIMWNALNGLWKKGRDASGGEIINVPLVGSGQSGVGLPARDLLNLIILSIITEKERITSKIRIVLYDAYFEELNLRDIKQFWKE